MEEGRHKDALDTVGRLIVDGRMEVGSVVTLAELGERLDVSRTVAREVVRVLESMRLVSSRRRVGITVAPEEQWDALDPTVIQWRLDGPGRQRQLQAIMELRSAVEPTAAALTASRADQRVGYRLEQLAARLEELGTRGLGRAEEYLDADVEFHSLLLDSCGNAMVAALKGPIVEALAWRSREGLTPERPAARAIAGHTELARAVVVRDTDAAARAARTYIDEVMGEVVGPTPPPSQGGES